MKKLLVLLFLIQAQVAFSAIENFELKSWQTANSKCQYKTTLQIDWEQGIAKISNAVIDQNTSCALPSELMSTEVKLQLPGVIGVNDEIVVRGLSLDGRVYQIWDYRKTKSFVWGEVEGALRLEQDRNSDRAFLIGAPKYETLCGSSKKSADAAISALNEKLKVKMNSEAVYSPAATVTFDATVDGSSIYAYNFNACASVSSLAREAKKVMIQNLCLKRTRRNGTEPTLEAAKKALKDRGIENAQIYSTMNGYGLFANDRGVQYVCFNYSFDLK